MSLAIRIVAGGLLALGTVTCLNALRRNLRSSPLGWAWYKALFHPSYWLEPFGSHYLRGIVLVGIGLVGVLGH